MPIIRTEYPKWIEVDGKPKLIQTEEEFKELSLDPEKEAIKKDLADNHGQEIDLAEFDGVAGMGALRAFYEAIKGANPNTIPDPVKITDTKPEVKTVDDKPAKKAPPKL